MLKNLTDDQNFTQFLLDIPKPKKLEKKDFNIDLLSSIMSRLRNENKDNQETTMSALKAIKFINSQVSEPHQLSLFEIQTLIKKGVLIAKETTQGIDKMNRNRRRYQIKTQEVKNLTGLIQLFEVGENDELLEIQKLPNKKRIIVCYQEMNQKKSKISNIEIKMNMLFELLKQKEFQKVLTELS